MKLKVFLVKIRCSETNSWGWEFIWFVSDCKKIVGSLYNVFNLTIQILIHRLNYFLLYFDYDWLMSFSLVVLELYLRL